MEFEYKITSDEYAAAQALYHRLTGGRKRVQHTISVILVGSFFLVVAWNQRPIDWAQFLVGSLGVGWIYRGVLNLLLPARHFRRYYLTSELAEKSFRAKINEDGLDVAGDANIWQVKWQGVRWKGEDKRVFMFYSYGTIFIFGKQYLTRDQQEEMRMLGGLKR